MTPEEANRAVRYVNGNVLGKKPLYVALAQRKADRPAAMPGQTHMIQPFLASSLRPQGPVGEMLQPGALPVLTAEVNAIFEQAAREWFPEDYPAGSPHMAMGQMMGRPQQQSRTSQVLQREPGQGGPLQQIKGSQDQYRLQGSPSMRGPAPPIGAGPRPRGVTPDVGMGGQPRAHGQRAPGKILTKFRKPVDNSIT